MIGRKQIYTEFVGFVTQRLLDLSREHLTKHNNVLNLTNVPASMVAEISWLKFDRIAKLASDYTHRLDGQDAIRLDVDLLDKIICEASETTPYSIPLSDEPCCDGSTSRRAYQSSIYSTLNAVFAALVSELRCGAKTTANELGVPTRLVWKLTALHSDQTMRVAKIYSQRVHFNDFFLMQLPLLQRTLALTYKQAEEENKLDRFITLGAPNRLMKELFNARSINIAVRREMLSFTSTEVRKQTVGRKVRSDLNTEERQEIFDLWVSMLDVDIVDRYLAVADQTKLRIVVIHAIIKEMTNEPYGQRVVNKLTHCA